MDIIKMQNLFLIPFDKGQTSHIIFLKKLLNDKAITSRFQGFLARLSNKNITIVDRAFLVGTQDLIIGYIDIGKQNNPERAIYLRAAIIDEFRGLGYGKLLLNEITDYLFKNVVDLKEIKLKISSNNIASLKTAESCGYSWIRDDYFGIKNPYLVNQLKM